MLNTTAWNRLRYGGYAPVYDAVVDRALRRARQTSLNQVQWRPGMRVLLVGAGTGLDLPWLPRDVELHATDLSPIMVQRLKRRATTLQRDVQASVMDASDLDYPDAHFDVVVMHLILAVMPAPNHGLAEAHRVLAANGQLCVMDKFQSDARPAGPGRRALNLVTSAIATDITRQARPLLEGAGFTIDRDQPVMMGTLFRALLAHKTGNPSSAEAD
ncbi:class I SAM-dependent methyltransferase [Halomonas sp. 18H]|uniref:class I SAM-dependent methyltransferase n=1 Tax=Halomonas almeriensis TaxID=308163 RepID=UPI00222F277C|nr:MULTISPECIES: class I SAM-dependent methyltransferase [Halomonas]MCW4152817.1 class I SAM-dependent methyltransferase [Halomonas sp. 18H]MDN3551984.1 class I SAM-dependent methyltransferase [Halomonas almeriensis]